MNKYSKFIIKTLIQSGKIVHKQFGIDGLYKTKSDKTDFLTKSDLMSHNYITSQIKKIFPEHGIISEEDEATHLVAKDGKIDEKEFFWIIDPIDGTNNFASKIPLYGVMMALIRNEEIIASGVYIPEQKEYYHAEKNKGAFLNGEKIKCSKKKTWPQTFGCSNASMNPKKKSLNKAISRARKQDKFWLSAFGSAAISGTYVASGRRDWYMSNGSMLWDYAPIALILKEAGCKVTNFKGEDWKIHHREILAANKSLHNSLMDLLK